MSTVVRRAALVGAMTGVSRLAGLVREQAMAYFFGTGLVKSAFDVAFRIPNLFRRLFGEGALSAAFVPVYTETLMKEGPAEANRLVGRVAGLLVAFLGTVTALGVLAALGLEQLLPPDSRWAAILRLLRVMLPYAPLICLAALAMGVLNALRHFALPALAPVFLNLVWILVLVAVCPFLPDDPAVRIRAVAWGVVAAGVVQVGVMLPPLTRRGVPLRLSLAWRGDARVARIVRLMAPMAFGAGLTQINVCVDGFLATWAAVWAPAALEYAERLVYLPMGIVGNAFSTVLLPTLSTHATGDDRAGLRETLESSLRHIAVIMAPAAVGLCVLALPIVELIYRLGSGAFQAESVVQTARALAGYAPGLLVFSFYKAITPAFFALQDTRTPMRVGIVSVCLNFALNVLFVVTWPDGWKHVGLAVATVLTSGLSCLVLAWVLHRRIGAPRLGALAAAYGGALASALAMGAVAWWVQGQVRAACMPHMVTKLAQLLAVGAAVAAGAAVYATLAWLLCRPALNELRRDLRGRRRTAVKPQQ